MFGSCFMAVVYFIPSSQSLRKHYRLEPKNTRKKMTANFKFGIML